MSNAEKIVELAKLLRLHGQAWHCYMMSEDDRAMKYELEYVCDIEERILNLFTGKELE